MNQAEVQWRERFYYLLAVVVVAALTAEVWIVTMPECHEQAAKEVKRFEQLVGRQDCKTRDWACMRGLDRDDE